MQSRGTAIICCICQVVLYKYKEIFISIVKWGDYSPTLARPLGCGIEDLPTTPRNAFVGKI